MQKKPIFILFILFFSTLTFGQKEMQVEYSYKFIETKFGRLKIQRTSNWYEWQKIRAIDSTLLDCIIKVEDYLKDRSKIKKSDSEIENLFNKLTKRAELNNLYVDLTNYKNELFYYKRIEDEEEKKKQYELIEQKKFDSIIDSKVREMEISDSIENAKQRLTYELKEKELQKHYAKNQALQKKINTEKRTKQKQEVEKKKNQRREDIIERYGKVNGEAILNHKVKIGWSKSMCIASWGKPSTINRTTTKYGIHEQYVYSLSRYLYFEDGILITIQD